MTPFDLVAMTSRQRKALREATIENARSRDGWSCTARLKVPEVFCAGDLDPHEIIPRSAWRDGIYVLSNVVSVCRSHHRWIDANPKLAHKRGLHGFSWERPDMRHWPLGTSNRTQLRAGREVEPIQHACTEERWSPYGRTYKAVCGTQVRLRPGAEFDPTHGRACPKCKAHTR